MKDNDLLSVYGVSIFIFNSFPKRFKMELPSIWLQDNLFKDKKKDSKIMQMINQDLIVHNLVI
jgi:hypothetical protein